MAVEFTYRDGSPIREGDVVQRGKGKGRWRVTDLIDWQGAPMVALASTTGYVTASVMRDGIAGLTRIETTTETPMTRAITVNRAALAQAVTFAAQAIPGRPSNPQQATLALRPEVGPSGDKVLWVVGGNYDTQLEAEVPAAWGDDAPIVVPGRLVAEWLKSERGDVVEIAPEGGSVVLKGRRTLTVPAAQVDAHERMHRDPNGTRTVAVDLDRDLLLDGLKRVGGTVSHDEMQPAFIGVHMTAAEDGLALVTTDRYKMSRVDVGVPAGVVDAEFEALPTHRELVSLLGQMPGPTVSLVREGGVLWVFSGNTSARIAVIEAEYPQIGHIFQMERPASTIIDAAALRAELQAAGQLIRLSTTSRTAKVRLTSGEDGLDVQVVDDSLGSTGVPVPYEGDPLDVDVDPAHLLGALDAVGPVEQVTIGHFAGPTAKPLRLSSPDSTGVSALMPMRRAGS